MKVRNYESSDLEWCRSLWVGPWTIGYVYVSWLFLDPPGADSTGGILSGLAVNERSQVDVYAQRGILG